MSPPPLAERLRPTNLDEYVGQQHLVGENGILRRMIDTGNIASFILWGPPGVGKTTIARIISNSVKAPFYTLSAVNSGVKEVREVLDRCKHDGGMFNATRPVLFIDEIHRFSKSQQDSLLAAVETGVITLIGATPENPSFEVIRPLLSRCQVFTLHALGKEDLLALCHRALTEDLVLKEKKIEIREHEALLRFSGGDARKLLGILEMMVESATSSPIIIDNEGVRRQMQLSPMAYDKDGEMHYDIISAFIKSIRGSSPDAALYWRARMIEGGEDPCFIARRLVISAAEDIGLANPNALLLANAAFEAVRNIGMPEGRIPLAQATVYLANSPKSNSAYLGVDAALALVRETGNLPVPLHLRNAPTQLMKELGYHDGYLYPHDYPNHFTEQQYMPDELLHTQLYHPCDNAAETKTRTYWDEVKKGG